MEQSFEVRFLNGLATGLWVVGSEYRMVCALKAPRLRLKEAFQRDESSRPGVLSSLMKIKNRLTLVKLILSEIVFVIMRITKILIGGKKCCGLPRVEIFNLGRTVDVI